MPAAFRALCSSLWHHGPSEWRQVRMLELCARLRDMPSWSVFSTATLCMYMLPSRMLHG